MAYIAHMAARIRLLINGKAMEIKITDISSKGEGIGRREDGLVVFVPGALPGDTVEAELAEGDASRSAKARLVSIKDCSDNRIEPLCPNHAECGGCELMGLSYEAQLQLKTRHVCDALRRIGGFKEGEDYVLRDILHTGDGSSMPLRYRNKAEFALSGNRAGYFKRGTHELLEIDDCLLVPKPVMDAVKARKSKLKPTQKYFRQLTVRTSCDGDIMTVTSNSDGTLTSDRKVLHDEIRTAAGVLKTEVSPQSFYQVNPAACSLLYSKVQEYAALGGWETVLDLYCGAGSIGLSMAGQCRRVIGVESVKPAVIDANRNAVINGIVNATFICGNAEDVIDTKLQGIKADVVILDPPRAGCRQSLLEAVRLIAPDRLIYVSCNPATLARDLKILCACDPGSSGVFRLVETTPVDMFPGSLHIETVCLLSNRKPDSYVHLNLKMEDYYRIKDAEKEQGKK